MNCVKMGTFQSGYLVSSFIFPFVKIFSRFFIDWKANSKLITGKDKSLPWITRLELAIDSARGLWFLHSYPDGCIVHRDIKVGLYYLHYLLFLPSLLLFVCRSFLQTIFLVPIGSQQTFSSTTTFKPNCQTSGYLKLWTWASPM